MSNKNTKSERLDYFDDQGRPDLQKLVLIFGGYNLITPAAWAQWHADVAECQANMRTGKGYRINEPEI